MIVVNPTTRQFTIPGSDMTFGVTADASSEVKHFQCPRYVGNRLDIAGSFVRINYRNANGEIDSYLVEDLTVDGDNVLFSWELYPKVTAYKGQIKFVMCVTGPDTKIAWHTTLGTGIVLEGLEPDYTVIQAGTADVVAQLLALVGRQTTAVADTGAEWVRNVQLEGTDQIVAVQTAGVESKAAAVAEIEAKLANSLASIPADYTSLGNAVEGLVRGRAGAIVCEAEGTAIAVKDASDMAAQGLRVFGKTTQVKTTGTQLVNFEDRTDSKGVTSTFSNDTLSVSGDGSAAYQYVRMDITNFVKNNPGKNLYLSYESVAAATLLDGSVAQINITLADGTSRYTTILTKDLERIAYAIPIDVSNIESAALAVYSTNNATPKSNRVTIIKPILNFGTGALPYETYSAGVASPSPGYPQELVSLESSVTVAGKNLVPPSTGTISAQGITSSPANEGTVLLNGTATQEISRVVSQNFLLQPGKYTLSVTGINKIDGNKDRVYLNAADNSGTIVNYVMVDKPVVFEIKSSVVVRTAIVFAPGSTYENKVVRIQIEVGDTATAPELYKPSQTVESTHVIRGIPVTTGGNYTDETGQQWICDEVDFERGVYVQRIGSVVFTEDDVLSTQANTIRLRRDISSINQSKGWCSITDNYVYNATLDTVHYYITGSNCWVFVPIGYDLNANRVELLYQFAAPIETPLTESELAGYRALRTYKPNTTVLNGSGAYMKVEYAADTKLYIDNKLAALVGNT